MKKGLLLAIPIALLMLCLQTARAQDSTIRPRRVPQLTSDDLAPAPSPAPVEEAAPAITNSSRSWSRHSYSDLGVSIEFPGKPPVPVPFQLQSPDETTFQPGVKAQLFRSPNWALSIARLNRISPPTSQDLLNFAAGFGDSLGLSNPEVLPTQGAEPSFRLNGTMIRNGETVEVKMRFLTHGKGIWTVMAQCRQVDAAACAAAAHTVDSVKINP